MTTPAPAQPPGEPFSEALSEAAQAAAMSVRLILTISDAVRRAAQKRHQGQEQENGPDAEKLAEGWSAEQLRSVLPQDALHDLMADADWPLMARQLAGLQHAGVDLTTFLPHMGRMAAGVHQAVTANNTRKAEGTDRWADLLRRTMPEGLVRDAILTSPSWPDIASAMGRLDHQGADAARILADAHAAGIGVDQAVAAVTTAAPAPTVVPPAPAPATTTSASAPTTPPTRSAPRTAQKPDPWATPAMSTDAKRSWGPLTENLDLPRNLDLGNRRRALQQLKINETAHNHMVAKVHEHLPQQEAALLVSTRQWPLLSARMHRMHRDGMPVDQHLARLAPDDATWRHGQPSETPANLLLATHHALTTPLDAPLPAAPRVSSTAARSRSTTTPTAPTGTQAPAGPAVPAHRQQTAPAPRQGRGR
ncbi:hypothetical protein [Streptomyces sp. PpalLS-921]|uniref:hypothetical protein n=1 Tax=Streptomyces sp. PpalLS-921 TaxID=1839772 RepID=UPI00081F0534|nr:hypothetical protein [Streptomyces sp. PpalLS-921]SCD43474.1 hypothetical protein GA0115249_104114 [Streptomyces sp. PpalLS-921]